MKYNIIVADPPWRYSDKLKQSRVKRGAGSHYAEMDNNAIVELDVQSIAAKNAVLALWCTSSHIPCGIQAVEAWGFEYKQMCSWVKTKKSAFDKLIKQCKKNPAESKTFIAEYDLNDSIKMNMGRIFRLSQEFIIIGTRGNVQPLIKNKSQLSVMMYCPAGLKHSEKPELLQDRLEAIFPSKRLKRLEMFARRVRPGWECVGNECADSRGEDIRDSLLRLKNNIKFNG